MQTQHDVLAQPRVIFLVYTLQIQGVKWLQMVRDDRFVMGIGGTVKTFVPLFWVPSIWAHLKKIKWVNNSLHKIFCHIVTGNTFSIYRRML